MKGTACSCSPQHPSLDTTKQEPETVETYVRMIVCVLFASGHLYAHENFARSWHFSAEHFSDRLVVYILKCPV